MRVIRITEQKFNSAHYLPDHPKCGAIHGHTYFVRNIIIEYNEIDAFVDFGDIKKTIMDWDHKLIIMAGHLKVWNDLALPVLKPLGINLQTKLVENGPPTVEVMAEQIAKEIKAIRGITKVSLELYEGPEQGALFTI